MTDPPTGRARTRLARLRTASGFAVLAVFLFRQALSRGSPLDLAAALLAVACAAACAAPVPPAAHTPPAVLRIRLLALAVVTMSCLALAGALASRS